MKLTQEQVNDLFFEGAIEVDGVTLEVEVEGEFSQDHKWQTAELIFTDGEKFYRSYVTREGSPYTDWYYYDCDDAEVYEVEKREITVTRWVNV